ncbi:MAG: cytochrome b subunit of the bc complex [Gemmatimonadetes bacterium]|nr:cytochrome b subunit of the bc complex [Gemmatimonadota bacterium]
MSVREEAAQARFPQEKPIEDPVPFVPNHILGELVSLLIAFAVLVVLAALLPAGLEPQADPLATPEHIKPEWYFLAVYQLLKLVPEVVGVLAPAVAGVALTLLPFLDPSRERNLRRRPVAMAVFAAAVLVSVGLTIWGKLS